MDQNVLYFFDRKPEALSLYEVFEKKVLSEVGNVDVKVQKTQIAFSNRHNFAFISFLPVYRCILCPQLPVYYRRRTKRSFCNYLFCAFCSRHPVSSGTANVQLPDIIPVLYELLCHSEDIDCSGRDTIRFHPASDGYPGSLCRYHAACPFHASVPSCLLCYGRGTSD